MSYPDTSIDAYKALTPEKLTKDYKHITNALIALREATYEEIGRFLQWSDLNKVSRRLKEMEVAEIVYKPGYKKRTSRNHDAYLYRLVPKQTNLIQKELF